MNLYDIIYVSGCITQEKYIKGKTLPELERILGFQQGRLDKGIVVAVLTQLPTIHQFEVLGYSQIAGHHFTADLTDGLDVNKIKEGVLQNTFTLAGRNRLVKVIPKTKHDDKLDDDIQYPPGQGVPQWKVTGHKTLSARVMDIVMSGGVVYY